MPLLAPFTLPGRSQKLRKPLQTLNSPVQRVPGGSGVSFGSGQIWGYRKLPPLRATPNALTDTAIRAAKAGDKPYKLADGGGLYLLVNPTGSRLWRLKCRIEGKEKLLAIGPYLDLSISPRRGSGATTSTAIIDGGIPSACKRPSGEEAIAAPSLPLSSSPQRVSGARPYERPT